MIDKHENYPTSIVLLNLLELLAAAAVGVVLVASFGWWAVLVYAAIAAVGMLLALAFGCTRCYYYGKVCGMGVGKIAPLFFPKRAESEFGKARSQTIAWTLVVLLLAAPAVAGLVSLATNPSWPSFVILIVFLGLLLLIVFTHSRLVCGRCRQWKDQRCSLGRMARSL